MSQQHPEVVRKWVAEIKAIEVELADRSHHEPKLNFVLPESTRTTLLARLAQLKKEISETTPLD